MARENPVSRQKARADTTGFGAWYAPLAEKRGLDPDPDSPLHFYDYRAAYRAKAGPNESGHWPSEYKKLGHPNLIVDGKDTRTGKKATPALAAANKKAHDAVVASR